MSVKAQVVVLPKDGGALRIVEMKLPDPKPHEVVIKQFASGICHSQLHRLHIPPEQRSEHELLGHESTGVVLATGVEVTHVSEGDHVMVTWVPRNAARSSRPPMGYAMQLPDGSQAATRNVFTWADHTLADEQFVVKIPVDAPTDVTSIIGCAVMTGAGAVRNTVQVKKGESVAIFGVGGVGLCALAAARQTGAYPIIAVDLDDAKLEFAKRFGATHGINAREEDPIQAIHRLTVRSGEFGVMKLPVSGVDYAFDCIGLKKTMEQVIPATRTGRFGVGSGGTAVYVGIPTTQVELDPIQLLYFERKLMGSLGGTTCPERDFPLYLDWHRQGVLDLDQLVTARYGLEQINQACVDLENGQISGRAILQF